MILISVAFHDGFLERTYARNFSISEIFILRYDLYIKRNEVFRKRSKYMSNILNNAYLNNFDCD